VLFAESRVGFEFSQSDRVFYLKNLERRVKSESENYDRRVGRNILERRVGNEFDAFETDPPALGLAKMLVTHVLYFTLAM